MINYYYLETSSSSQCRQSPTHRPCLSLQMPSWKHSAISPKYYQYFGRQKQEDLCEFKASLIYKTSFRTARATKRNSVSKTNNRQTKAKNLPLGLKHIHNEVSFYSLTQVQEHQLVKRKQSVNPVSHFCVNRAIIELPGPTQTTYAVI